MASLKFLSCPSSDTASPLLSLLQLQLGPTRYLFNVPEGSTRAITQRKAAASKCKHIFLSSIGTDSSPGLAGLLLTLSDAKTGKVTLHGPQATAHFVASMRSFAKKDNLQLDINQFESQPSQNHLLDDNSFSETRPFFKDENITVEALDLQPPTALVSSPPPSSPSSSPPNKRRKLSPTDSIPKLDLSARPWRDKGWKPQALSAEDADLWAHAVAKDMFHLSKSPGEAHALDDPTAPPLRYSGPAWVLGALPTPKSPAEPVGDSSNPLAGSQRSALTYIIRSHPLPGRFDPSAALALGVPPGKLWADLTKGDNVTVEVPTEWDSWDFERKETWLKRKPKKVVKGKKAAVAKPDEPAPEAEPVYTMKSVQVASEDVVGAQRPGFVSSVRAQTYERLADCSPFVLWQVVILVHISTEAHAVEFFSSATQASLTPYQSSQGSSQDGGASMTHSPPHLIVHSVTSSVLFSDRYQAWMRSFPNSTNHVISSRDVCADNFTFPSAAHMLLRLSLMDNNMFVVPNHEPIGFVPQIPGSAPDSLQGTFAANAGMVVSLRPLAPPQLQDSDSPEIPLFQNNEELIAFAANQRTAQELVSLDPETVRGRLVLARETAWKEYLSVAQTLKRQVEEEAVNVESAHRQDPTEQTRLGKGVIITPLGTGSAAPSKYRNVSSTLIQTPLNGNILLDVGESTFGQLSRRFAKHRVSSEDPHPVDQILRDLNCIFVSHIHADHHLGLAKLLVERRKVSLIRSLSDAINQSF